MKPLYILIIVLLFPSVCYANLNWESWQNDSPFGKFYFDYDGYGTTTLVTLNCSELVDLKNLDQWYFYNGYIIGSYKNHDDNRFFIYNENKCEGSLFSNSSAWEAEIKSKDLQPSIWTRWYSQNWNFFNRMSSNFLGAMLFIVLFYLSIPLGVIVVALVIINYFTRWKLKYSTRHVIILMVIVGVVAIRWILDSYPQSF